MTELAGIDRAALDSLLDSVGGDLEFLAELVREFVRDGPRQFGALKQALSDGDSEALRRAAHTMKSNSATFGAMSLSAKFRELEHMGRDCALEGASAAIAQAQAGFEAVAQALTEVAGG
jgi:HPt (histidine-containing phosphotransfer) domain-containing protein